MHASASTHDCPPAPLNGELRNALSRASSPAGPDRRVRAIPPRRIGCLSALSPAPTWPLSLSLSLPLSLPLSLSLFLALALVMAAPSTSQEIQQNLVVNGAFDTDLAGWMEENDENLTSNWSSFDANGSNRSGSFWGGAKEQSRIGGDTAGWVLGQCIQVSPGRHAYSVSGRYHPDNEIGDAVRRASLILLDRTGAACSLVGPDPFQALEAANLRHVDWTTTEGTFQVTAGQSQLFVGVWMEVEEFGTGREDLHAQADDIVVGRLKPDLGISRFTVGGPAAQLEEVEIEVDISSLHNGLQPSVRIHHDGRLTLVSENCPGNVTDVSQGADHFFSWWGSPGSNLPYNLSCTIVARTTAGSSGSSDLRAVVDCAECALDADPADNEATAALVVPTDPDLATQVTLEALPNRGDEFSASVTFSNHGDQLTVGRLELRDRYAGLAFVSSDCLGFGAAAPQTDGSSRRLFAQGDFVLGPGGSETCEVVLSSSDAGAVELWAIAATSSAGDYRPSNDESMDATVLVDLRPDTGAVDTPDASPGDGHCADTEDRCTLRAAVMEAMALDGTRTVHLSQAFSPYRLSASSGSGDGDHGALLVDRRLTVIGEAATRGSTGVPVIEAAFPGGAEDRLFLIDGASFVRLEHLELVGEGLAPATGDGYGGHGGLIHHASGELVLRDVTLRDGASDGDGGAVYSGAGVLGDLTLERVRILGSHAPDGSGGGLAFDPGAIAFLQVSGSEFAGNSAANGGGIWVRGQQALPEIVRSAIHDNTAEFYGGGIYFAETPTAVLANSTVSGNDVSVAGGGGIMVTALMGGESDLLVHNSTIVHNRAVPDDPEGGAGGGIYQGPGSTVELYGSILAYNVGGRRGTGLVTFPDGGNCFGAIDSRGYNTTSAISTDLLCSIDAEDGDAFDSAPSLGPLADHGGPTPTHALTADGSEVDQGDPACLDAPGGSALVLDQRSFARPADGDGDGTARCDKGAWEKGAVAVSPDIFSDGFESGDVTAWN